MDPPPVPVPPAGDEPQKGMSDYCKSLEHWLWKSYWHREAAVSAYYTALSMLYPVSNGNVNGSYGYGRGNGQGQFQQVPGGQVQFQQVPGGQVQFQQVPGQQFQVPGAAAGQQRPIIRQILIRGIRVNGNAPLGIDFNVAPVWKRLVAECIDFLILLVVKIFITVSIIDAFDLFDLDNIDLEALQDSDALLEMAYSLSLTQLLLLELTHRLTVCVFEAYCLSKSGATPGKNMLSLRVLHCDSIFPIGINVNNNQEYINVGSSRVIIAPGTLLSFKYALLRSVIKNFSLAFFFPFCFTLFHFEYSRTLYDLTAKSIVIEVARGPVVI